MRKDTQGSPLPLLKHELGNMEDSSARTAQAPPPILSQPLSLQQDIRHPIVGEIDTSCTLDAEGHCITCSDEALQVRVLHVDEENGLAQVTLNGIEEEIDISLVDSIEPGDVLLVHGGVAIERLDEASDA